MSQFTTSQVIDKGGIPLVPILLSAVVVFILFKLSNWSVSYLQWKFKSKKKRKRKKSKKRKKKENIKVER